jgi:prepilin-type N-terminal cleavage/methylation domain-containing protein
MSVEEKGFTLAEMLVTSSVLGILLAAAAVGLGTLAPQFDLDNAAQKVAMALNQGRVQAITTGHTMVVAFNTNDEGAVAFTITDDVYDEIIATDIFPPHITVSADRNPTFTPLGTVTAPVTVTVSNSHGSRDISVGLIGEVQIQ